MSSGPFADASDVKKALLRDNDFHDGFQTEVKKHPKWRSLGIALVDLTTGKPRYATTDQENVDKHVFSLAKLAPLVAAFRLRERLRNQFDADPAKTADELIAKIEKAWKPTVTAAVKGRPGKPDFPNLKRIFSLNGPPWTFDFKGDTVHSESRDKLVMKMLRNIDNEYPADIDKDEMKVLVFMHRVKLMIRWSDNNAAGSVASDLGLSYIFGVLTSEGLYNQKASNGLWLSNTYGYDDKFMGFEGSGYQLTAGATAYAIAEYYTRLTLGTLVDADSSTQMLKILRNHFGIGSFFPTSEGTGKARHKVRRITHSKVGYFNKTANSSEGAIVESDGADGKTVRFIAVVLQDVGGNQLDEIITVMDAYVRKVNGVI